ncbi:hypothetical protein BH10PSE17_BH10PSE17_21940 [soil metagenome]
MATRCPNCNRLCTRYENPCPNCGSNLGAGGAWTPIAPGSARPQGSDRTPVVIVGIVLWATAAWLTFTPLRLPGEIRGDFASTTTGGMLAWAMLPLVALIMLTKRRFLGFALLLVNLVVWWSFVGPTQSVWPQGLWTFAR